MGWNCRGWGWAAEQIVGIDVVTAEGSSVFCNENVNPDLFWSARGSGPRFFAIVTRFHLRSRPIPSGMLSSTYIWNISKYDEVVFISQKDGIYHKQRSKEEWYGLRNGICLRV